MSDSRSESGAEPRFEGATAEVADRLRKAIADRSAKVGVVGLGYVGLPVALSYCEAGFPVLGADVDPNKVDQLMAGECYIRHLEAERLSAALATGHFEATAELARLGEADVIVICVPTPIDGNQEPDLSYVLQTAEQIAGTLREGQLVILESTTYPGTTDEELVPRFESPEFRCGEHFFVAYSPEREDPGNESFGTTDIPKVVGGVDEVSGDLAAAFYGQAFTTVERVSSARTAEATKLMENIFRAVNIALVNELKVVYDRMGIDVWEVLDAADTKPFGYMRFDPGPGWGGHCIPVDPFYLSWKAARAGVDTRFIQLAGEINIEMTAYVLDKLKDALEERGGQLGEAKILVLGLAYKRDIDDPRESPAFEILHRLLEAGARVRYHDPHIPQAPAMRSWPELPLLRSVALTAEEVQAADAVVLITDHRDVDYELVAREARLIIDTRGVFRRNLPSVVRA